MDYVRIKAGMVRCLPREEAASWSQFIKIMAAGVNRIVFVRIVDAQKQAGKFAVTRR